MGFKVARFYLLSVLMGMVLPLGATASPLHGGLRFAGVSLLNHAANPSATIGTSVEYNFYDDYSLDVDYSYSSPLTEVKEYLSNGLNDVGLYVSDKSIWADKPSDLNISGRIGVLLPLSESSRTSSMTFGLTGGFSFKKGLGHTHSVTYSISGEYLDHVYQTAVEDDKTTVFNTRFDFSHKLSWAFDILKSLHMQMGATLASYYDYSSSLSNVYSLGLGMSYDIDKSSSVDIGFRTSMQNPSDRVIWNGPAAASRLFRPEGSLFTVGTTIEI